MAAADDPVAMGAAKRHAIIDFDFGVKRTFLSTGGWWTR